MRRWNGWGDDTVRYPLTARAVSFLEDRLGPGVPAADAALDDVLARVPESSVAESPLITTDREQRLRHARGQSLPDWIALRSGQITSFPAGVAFPQDDSEIAGLIEYAAHTGVKLIPYGGGTSVVGHINPLEDSLPAVTVSMRRMNRMKAFNERDHLATFEAGASGPEIEAQLRARGCTLGHFPQSFEFSTLGGWIATRSTGQQALLYGRIEDLYAGGTVITPAGRLDILPHPASAAGPDLRYLVLGSEGRIGFISQAAVRVSPLPEVEAFHGLFFADFASGETAVREMVQAQLPLSMLRLSTAVETETTLILAGHERLIGLMEQYLNVRGIADEKAMLIAGFSGRERIVDVARKEALAIAKDHGAVSIGQQFGKQWQKSRFRTPYLRNALWDRGYAIDTLETAVPWHRVEQTMTALENALANALADTGERIHLFSHLSHLYSSGASIYVTYLFRRTADPEETWQRWQRLKTAASAVIVEGGGTISHQHGVGSDHKPYLHAEKGDLGIALIKDAVRRADPRGMMNPGKLVDAAWAGSQTGDSRYVERELARQRLVND